MIKIKLLSTVVKFLLNIFFYINIKNNLLSNFNIFIHKFNTNKNKILKYFKINNNKSKLFNFRNKLNFNKSRKNLLNNRKKIGKSRLGSSSSHILRKGSIWFGLRNLPLKELKYNSSLLKYFILFKKNILSITTLEAYKFIYSIAPTVSSNIINYCNFNNDLICINSLSNYISLNKHTNGINITY